MLDPGLDPIYESSIRVSFEIPAKPDQIYSPRIVASPRLGLHVSGFAMPSQKATDRRFSNAK